MKAHVRRGPKKIAVRALALGKAVGDFESLIPSTLDIRRTPELLECWIRMALPRFDAAMPCDTS
ncbi:MAG: hypothetical protein ABWY12_03965 [Burkholderiales bacterium]